MAGAWLLKAKRARKPGAICKEIRKENENVDYARTDAGSRAAGAQRLPRQSQATA